MSTIELHVNPDVAAYVAAGQTPAQTVTIDLDALDPEQRALLARHVGPEWTARDGARAYTLTGYCSNDVRVGPGVCALLAALAGMEEGQAAAAEQERARTAGIEARCAAVLVARQTREARARGDQYYTYAEPDWPYGSERAPSRKSADAIAWEAELEAARVAARDAAVQAATDLRAATEARRAAALAELSAWAAAHGSERVHLLMEEGHASWVSVAEREYLDSVMPEGYAAITVSHRDSDRTHPTAEDILALRAARALADGTTTTDARLVWVTEYRPAEDDEEADGDGEAVSDKYATVALTLRTPTGSEREVYRRTGSQD